MLAAMMETGVSVTDFDENDANEARDWLATAHPALTSPVALTRRSAVTTEHCFFPDVAVCGMTMWVWLGTNEPTMVESSLFGTEMGLDAFSIAAVLGVPVNPSQVFLQVRGRGGERLGSMEEEGGEGILTNLSWKVSILLPSIPQSP